MLGSQNQFFKLIHQKKLRQQSPSQSKDCRQYPSNELCLQSDPQIIVFFMKDSL